MARLLEVRFLVGAVFVMPFLIFGCGRTPLALQPDAGTRPDVVVPLPDGRVPDAPPDARPDSGPCSSDLGCDDLLFCNGAERCVGGRCSPGIPTLCDDSNGCTTDTCDEALDTCFFVLVDADGDGFSPVDCGGEDCDDTQPRINPLAFELCDNGIDDDCNTLPDCADVACSGSPDCMCEDPMPFENCANGRDDDCDGFVDCADSECSARPVCNCDRDRDGVLATRCGGRDCNDGDPSIPSGGEFTEARCRNGEDDDCDGQVDCADMDCEPFPVCSCTGRPEICGNGVDDDCDREIDCADEDCGMDPLCRSCPDRDLGSAIGDSVANGNTSGEDNTLTASCGSNAESPDISFVWTAPRGGRWLFDTLGSRFDTVLHLHADSCDGDELACDDDGAPGALSRIVWPLRAGQRIVITVDGFGRRTAGAFVLNIHPFAPEVGNCGDGVDNDVDGLTDCDDSDCSSDPLCTAICPDRDLGTRLGNGVATGTTAGQGNHLMGSCGGGSAPDLAFSWEAPVRGRYIFNTGGSAFDTVLYMRSDDCDGAEIRCNEDGGVGQASRIQLNLEAGDRFAIVVDGMRAESGTYRLNIIASEAGFCTDGIDNDSDGRTDCADTQCDHLAICCMPSPEICGNGSDEDCDGLVDCADPNCATSPLCCTPAPENCANGADEDCDGLIDCVDPDCGADPRC